MCLLHLKHQLFLIFYFQNQYNSCRLIISCAGSRSDKMLHEKVLGFFLLAFFIFKLTSITRHQSNL